MSELTDSRDQQFMARALELADIAESEGEVPVGALLVKGDEIIAEGWNRPITGCDPTGHAEIEVLRKAALKLGNYRLPDTTLYVTIEPCTMCVGAMIHARIKHLVFGAREPRAGAICSQLQLLEFSHYNHLITWQEGVMEDSCGEKLSRFFKERRNR